MRSKRPLGQDRGALGRPKAQFGQFRPQVRIAERVLDECQRLIVGAQPNVLQTCPQAGQGGPLLPDGDQAQLASTPAAAPA